MSKKVGRTRSFRFHWRKMTWLFVLFNIGMIVWLIAGSMSASKPTDCGNLSAQTCQDAANVGTGLAVVALIIVWIVGFFVLGLLWLMTRPSRHCPQCGSGVKRGRLQCKRCGYDFRVQPQGYSPASS